MWYNNNYTADNQQQEVHILDACFFLLLTIETDKNFPSSNCYSSSIIATKNQK